MRVLSRLGQQVRAVTRALPRLPLGGVPRLARRLPFVAAVTGLGWAVTGGCVVAGVAGLALGWTEFELAAMTGLGVMALCALLMIGRTRLDVTLEPERSRMRVGESIGVAVTVTNNGAQPLILVAVEVPIGVRVEPVPLPGCAAATTRTTGRTPSSCGAPRRPSRAAWTMCPTPDP